jgi:segregation and condensation protein B
MEIIFKGIESISFFMPEEKKLVEAALFMSPKALSVADLMGVMGTSDYGLAKRIAFELMAEFNARDSALEIIESDGLFQMRVKPPLEPRVQDFAAESMFNKGTMKTLALIAFKQPILQSSVIKYRNNKAYDHISRLLKEGFIAREPHGQSYFLRTTKKFFEYFGKEFGKEK